MHTLTEAYAAVPTQMLQTQTLSVFSKAQQKILKAQQETREKQVASIDAIHTTLTAYMSALGTLAKDDTIETSTDINKVTTGIADLKTSGVSIGVTSAQISAASSLATYVTELAAAGYRQAELIDAIEKGHEYLPTVITSEETITQYIILSLKNLKGKLTDVRADTVKKLKAGEKSGTSISASSTIYLLQKSLDTDLATNETNLTAAEAYLTALKNISKAYEQIYQDRNSALTTDGAKRLLEKIKPDLTTAYDALQTLSNL